MVFGQIFQRPGSKCTGVDESVGSAAAAAAAAAAASIAVNVGGFKRRLEAGTLRRFPHTRLGRLMSCDSEEAILELCDDYDVAEREFYFDRNPCVFPCIVNFYYTGRLHVADDLCAISFSQEMEYWGIHRLFLDSCCSLRFQERMHEREDDNDDDEDWDGHSDDSSDRSFIANLLYEAPAEAAQGGRCARCRRELWLVLENPAHSLVAKLVAVCSLAAVLVSIATLCVHSVPEFRRHDAEGKEMEDPNLELVEGACVAWFTVEFFLRLATAPDVKAFARNPLNVIDFASVMPFFVTLAVDRLMESGAELQNVGRVVQILRLMRIFRILKLARHSTGLRSLGATLRHSYQEVGVLLLFLSVGISIFSVLVYSVEKDEEESSLQTIPMCWWWATISMTTVGYGDTYPITVLGKMLGTACIVCGILVVALPITIIFNKFSKYYQLHKALEAAVRQADEQSLSAEDLPGVNIRDYYARKMTSLLRSVATSGVGGVDYDEDSDASGRWAGERGPRLRARSGGERRELS
uniref:Potassium voltage-gated channel subfamily S member 3-like n=1 Tax=Petromyzon marinus TaxID=7757 RepID=A0AAJ7T014_PETMA|nr:potassium voltage-gated channel subfamily S member 3-like [Petromyzon marinus]